MKYSKLGIVTLMATLGLFSCDKLMPKSLDTDEAKYSYAIGYQFAKDMKGKGVPVDSAALELAVREVMDGKDPKMTDEEMQNAMKAMYEARREKEAKSAVENKEKGDKYLEENKSKEGVKVTSTGLQYQVVEEGSGASPSDDSVVTVHYKGVLIDGTEFDSSYKRNEPATFPVGGVIPGWQEALKMMKKGAKWKLYIPPDLAYGDRARPQIPANSVLVFDVELLEIKSSENHKSDVKKKIKKGK